MSDHAARTLLDHCLRERPREACGWVSGRWERRGGVIVGVGLRAHPMRNVASDPVRRYLMEPEEQFAVLRELRRAGEELVAIYHSHPESPPLPSETDVDLAYTKDVIYLIVSPGGSPPRWRAWWLDCDTRRVAEVAVHGEGGRPVRPDVYLRPAVAGSLRGAAAGGGEDHDHSRERPSPDGAR